MDADEYLIINNLREVGLDIHDIDDLMRIKEPLSDSVINVLITGLQNTKDESLQEFIIRGITGQRLNIDSNILLKLYDSTPNEYLRWAIANCIAESEVANGDLKVWLKHKVQSEGNEILFLAASHYLNHKEVLPLLMKGLYKHNDVIYEAIGEIGTLNELPVLEEEINKKINSHSKKQLNKAIKKIKRRYGKKSL